MTQRVFGSVGVAVLVSLFTGQARKTRSTIGPLHECALVMIILAAAGVLASLWLRRVETSAATRERADASG